MKIKNSIRKVRYECAHANRRGFTIMEILIVVAIIMILVTILLVSMSGSRKKAMDNSAFTSFKSAAAPVYMCLTSSLDLNPSPSAGNNICNDTAATDAVWPDFSKYGWSNDLTSGNPTDPNNVFYWCSVDSTNSSVPTNASDQYEDGIFGGDKATGNFCFMMKNGDEYMWCTLTGCSKQGF